MRHIGPINAHIETRIEEWNSDEHKTQYGEWTRARNVTILGWETGNNALLLANEDGSMAVKPINTEVTRIVIDDIGLIPTSSKEPETRRMGK